MICIYKYLMIPEQKNRELKGRTIAGLKDSVRRIDERLYKVKSQSGNGKEYDVTLTEERGWICSCPDFAYRNEKCKHLFATEISLKLREKVREQVIIQPVNISDCTFCHCISIKKYGVRRTKIGSIQRFLCSGCKRTFSINIGFEKMKHNPQAVTTAMQLYFSGESLRNTQKSIRLLGVQVSHQTIYNWIGKYVSLMEKYVEKL
jgi:putative transposase